MHEESRTRQAANTKYENVIGTNRYGESGKHLSPIFEFEQEYYDTPDAAAHAAEHRSKAFGDRLDETTQRHTEASQAFRRLLGGTR